MTYRNMRCAAIHDLSGVGKCSLTVALPILSACGVETAVMPTAVLSTHTGGFTGYTYRDLTEDLLPMARHWKKEGCRFEALYSGFLGSPEQIGLVSEIFSLFREEGTLVAVDPVMGDGGKLYATYTQEMADGMGTLCRGADLVMPNFTEACHILGLPYREGPYTREYVREILRGLLDLGPRMAVLTGVWQEEGCLGAACLERGQEEPQWLLSDRVPGSYHGTGDVFGSTLVAGLLNGMTLPQACQLAVDYTQRVIVTTHQVGGDLRMGPKFECHLPWLCQKMADFREGKGA